jgi:predicted RNA-binding protein with PUA domain
MSGNVAGTCHDCPALASGARCAEARAVVGIPSKHCSACGGERHNRRTCTAPADVVMAYQESIHFNEAVAA